MRALVLDSHAVSILARYSDRTPEFAHVHTFLTAAIRTKSPIRVPAAVLAEQYRGRGYDQAIDAFWSRHKEFVKTVDTDRDLARVVGNLLARHHRGTADHVDATVVASAYRLGGGVILTSDADDIEVLAGGHPNIEIELLQ